MFATGYKHGFDCASGASPLGRRSVDADYARGFDAGYTAGKAVKAAAVATAAIAADAAHLAGLRSIMAQVVWTDDNGRAMPGSTGHVNGDSRYSYRVETVYSPDFGRVVFGAWRNWRHVEQGAKMPDGTVCRTGPAHLREHKLGESATLEGAQLMAAKHHAGVR